MNEQPAVKLGEVELTQEEIKVLKEVAQDRVAVSRVWRMVRNFALAMTAIIVGYVTIVENGLKWLKTHLGM